MIQLSVTVLTFSLSRVLRPPGGGSNISFGADEEKPPVRKNKMASSVFAEPEDPYANRRNNPPGIYYLLQKCVALMWKPVTQFLKSILRAFKSKAEKKTAIMTDKFGKFASGVLKITARPNCSSASPGCSKSQTSKYIRIALLCLTKWA